MCIYPRLIENKKYKSNKKNGGIIPDVKDGRQLYVPVGCGKCMECKKQKGRGWAIRMQEDIKHNKNAKFVTLTFNEEELTKLKQELDYTGYELENEVAKLAVKRFRERWRKKYGKSIRHWLVTELGGGRTERIHIHGIVWTNEKKEEIEQKWKYGMVWQGEYVNEKTINYIVKYVNKIDEKHKEYESIILTSAGIGKDYLKTRNSKRHGYKKGETKEEYVTRTGNKIGMPSYWRNKIWTEEERNKLWTEKLNEEVRYVDGVKIDVSTEEGEKMYIEAVKEARKKNKRLGYGNDEKNWKRVRYENERRRMLENNKKKKK